MSAASQQRSEDFLKVSRQFRLGALTTEASHPLTANLSEVARRDLPAALRQLFDVDDDVLSTYRDWVKSGRSRGVADALRQALSAGGRLFFTGCGSTGRLSIQLVSIWRDFWQRQRAAGQVSPAMAEDFEQRALAVMAGGDYALIKSVEGFEDYTAFGRKQIADLGVGARDVVLAITEGGETSFVIGTAWQGIAAGARVYFVYNNPDEILCREVERSREVIEDARIEKINLTTGPMAITGSTRMQATTIQLAVLLTVLEMVVRDLLAPMDSATNNTRTSDAVAEAFLEKLAALQATLKSAPVLEALARLVALEESVYRAGHRNNYYADRFGLDVLTDTTERSPTYCTPPFRKFDDPSATESWAFLFVPEFETPAAWTRILKRHPVCVEWSATEVRALVDEDKAERTQEIVRRISQRELMRFKVGGDGMSYRPLGPGDSAVGILAEEDIDSLALPDGFMRQRFAEARRCGAATGLMYFGRAESFPRIEPLAREIAAEGPRVLIPTPPTDFWLDGITRVMVKTVLNVLSTATMVRLGRVMGNYMIWVVPSNLKLIDRSTRYVQQLTGLDYPAANQLLFESIEYIEPRMRADQAYPPVVGLTVLRHRFGLSLEAAEKRLKEEAGS